MGTERLTEVVDKLALVEKTGEEHERSRKILESQSFQNEEKIELLENQLEEAKQIAEDSDRKQDEISRKLRIVEGDLDRIVDRCEEYEQKIVEYESKAELDRNKLKEMEDLALKNGTQTDKLKDDENRAEFGERSVDKLESTIDNLQEGLYNEKSEFIDLSKKLDQTLTDMMEVK